MNKIKDIFKRHKKYFLIGGGVLVIIIFFISRGGGDDKEVYAVGRANLEQSVVLSGKVETSDKADLGFAVSGRLSQIFVKNNQSVSAGQMLAQLEVDDLLADLKIKQASYKISDSDLESNVENTYRTLLSSDLVPTPNREDYNLETPIIGGIYEGAEGRYKIILNREDIDMYISTFGLEKTKRVLKESAPTPFGTKGLYISFGDADVEDFDDTTWYLDIPNKSSSSYVANYNEYNEEKKRLDSALKSGEDNPSSAIAQAEIQKINAEIRKNTIYAPFSGRVTNIEKEVGENASVGERVISVLGEEKLEIILQVSELDVSRLTLDSSIKLSFDAFSGEDFYGILKTINSRETEIDGVPVY